MSKRLDRESKLLLKYLPQVMKERQRSFKLMFLNRNKKVCFALLQMYKSQQFVIHSCILPDDVFVLAIFDDKNQLLNVNQDSLMFDNLSLKEVYFYGKEMHDLDWLYEGDFRKKDSFFYVIE
jgi:hypothetical protein